MTFRRLLLENLFYHWRGNLAVLLGVVVGTAVLTGALLVGDSLRGSLRAVAEEQLGWVDLALVGKRFFREELVSKLPAERLSPAILLQVSAAREEKGQASGKRARQVVLLGVDQRFWNGSGAAAKEAEAAGMPAEFWNPPENRSTPPDQEAVVLGAALADDLEVTQGDRITIFLQKVSSTPRESLLGKRDTREVLATLSLRVAAVLPDDHFGSRFALNPGPSLPRNAFVPLRYLQEKVYFQQPQGLARLRFPRQAVNAAFVSGADKHTLAAALKERMQLTDWGLVFRTEKIPGFALPKYLSLESRELFVPDAAEKAVEQAKLRAAPTLVYLVNNVATSGQVSAEAIALVAPPGPLLTRPAVAYRGPLQLSYALVAALDPEKQPPLGPFLPAGRKKLAEDEILLVDWKGSPLKDLKEGAQVALTYYEPDVETHLKEGTHVFRVAGQVPLAKVRDPYLTPLVAGMTDSFSKQQWDVPFPFDESRVTKADNDFFRNNRTTPQAFVTLQTGQKLWGSRFGKITSIRIDPQGESRDEIAAKILAHLNPEEGGLVFREVRSSKLQAASQGTDFSGYFLGFSSFLIVAALLMVGLLFRLNIDRRAAEIGLLLAVGHRRWQVRGLLLAEGGLLAVLGALIGLLAAIGYAELLLSFLSVSWPGGLSRSFLHLYVAPLSLVGGFAAAVVISVLAILWVTRVLSKAAPRDLLAGATTGGEGLAGQRRSVVSKVIIGISLVGAAVCFVAGGLVQDHEMKASSFMGSGMLLLTAGLSAVWLWLRRPQQQSLSRGGPVGLALLGIRNAGRHPVRSLLTLGLLALATFVIVAIEAFHRDAGRQFLEKTGGSGGFPLLAESDVPVFEDLNSSTGRAELAKANADQPVPADVTFYPFRVKEGDDVSCLNLYQAREPRIFGVPNSILRRGGFQFAGTEASTDDERANPWLLLEKKRKDGVIPVFGENDTVTYVLKSYLGGEVTVKDESGRPVRLRIVGLLQDSVFQSELLMSDASFRRLYPRLEGFQFFLIDAPPEQTTNVRTILDKALADYGLAVTDTPKRLETYLAVVNTYLSTFQALGGLGLLLGALGLAVVLLRSVWERRGEFALLRALGFRRSALSWLVLAENACLLILGLLVGTIAALLSVAPHLVAGSEVPWLEVTGLLGLVMVVGLLAAWLAIRATVQAPLLAALRRE
jgi:ABC-type antimicrobial peptide transport system permease subunit